MSGSPQYRRSGWGCGMVEPTPSLINKAEIRRAFSLLSEPGQVVEVRALRATTQPNPRYLETLSGYFDNPLSLLQALQGIRFAVGIYITLQPCDPELLGRANNKLLKVEKEGSTSNNHIVQYQRLLI